LENVLHVPIESVFDDEGKPVCYVRRADGRVEKRGVKPGRTNDHYVEVLDGLADGESVQLFAPGDAAAGGVGKN
jgi:multidrug efflux pump subunit AcrA (membrane-fusion protein)